jgi:Secretion system C-terminal sorting domain
MFNQSMKKIILFLIVINTFIANAQYNYYYGNIHSHTAYSDGNKDSATTNVFTPYQSFAYAKASYHIDFWGISEHNHYSSKNNPGFQLPLYALGLQQADSINDDGFFVAMFGVEYGVISTGGHVVTYGLLGLIGWEVLSGQANYDIFCGKGDYNNYWKIVNQYPNTFTTLAHPDYGDYDDLLGSKVYKSNADSQIVGTAIRSGGAFSTTTNYSDNAASLYDTMYNYALAKGYHLGSCIDHDNHYTNFGRTNQGRTVVLANSLSRDSIIAAYKANRFYASDDWNAEVKFSINQAILGQQIYSDSNSTINISIADADVNDLVDSIEIYYGEIGSGIYPTLLSYTTNKDSFKFIHLPSLKKNYYYYAKITQKDNDIIWTSPIWVHFNSFALSTEPIVNPNSQKGVSNITLYPNPSKDQTTLSFFSLENCQGVLKLYNTQGVQVHQQSHQINAGQNQIVISHQPIISGQYFLVLQKKDQKLVETKLTIE